MMRPLIPPALRKDGLSYHGTVTSVVDETHFKSEQLAGEGDDFFGGPNNLWYVYVARDSAGAGALPQGELQPISNYVSADGEFTHSPFSTALGEGDEILIINEKIVIDYWHILPTRVFDNFDDNSKNTAIWGPDNINGSTTITETGGEVKINNPGTGTAGYSYRPTVKKFGKSLIVEAWIGVTSGESGGDGERCEAYIELYKDEDNYIRFGLYRDTSEAINSRGYVTYNIAGAGESSVDVDNLNIDTIARRYRIIVGEHNVQVSLDNVSNILGSYAFENLDKYEIRLVAGTENNTDVIDIRFDDFSIRQYDEDAREIFGKLESIQGGSESIQNVKNAIDSFIDLAREAASGTLTADGTEQTLIEITANSTPYEFGGGSIKLDNMQEGDTTIIRKYKKIANGDTYEVPFDIITKNGAQQTSLEIDRFYNQYGLKITLEQTAGTNRTYKHEWFAAKA